MPEAQKKIILFVVEGQSDSIALKVPLRNLLKNAGFRDRFEIDIYGTDPLIHNRWEKNHPEIEDPFDVITRVGNGVQDYLKSSKNKGIIKPSDIAAVILLSDLDACYCDPDSVVQKASSASETVYDADAQTIRCGNVDYIRRRNEAKKDAIGILVHDGWLPLSTNKKPIPLGIFYFNINREHALNGLNKPGMSENEKIDIAIRFRQDYGIDANKFYALLKEKLPGDAKSYLDSWNESLLRRHAYLPACNLALISQWIKESLLARS